MINDKAHKIAIEVRHWAENVALLAEKDNHQGWDSDLTNMCVLVSSVLAQRLYESGFTSVKLADSGCHSFVLLDDWIIDLTATQFGDFDKVFIAAYSNVKHIAVMWNEIKHLPKFELAPWCDEELEIICGADKLLHQMKLHTKCLNHDLLVDFWPESV